MKSTVNGGKGILLERVLTLGDRISVHIGAVILSVVIGPPGAILTAYVQNQDLYESVTKTVYLFFGLDLPIEQGILGLGILSVLLFYLFYMIHFMHMRLVKAKPSLLSLLSEDEEAFQRIFGSVSKNWPPILIGLFLIVSFSLQSIPEIPGNFSVYCTDISNVIFLAVSYPLWFMVFSTFAWVYFSSIRGLHQMGDAELELKPFYEDRMLGVRPIGSLSLSFAFTYFTGLGILALLPFAVSQETLSTGYLGILVVLSFLGVAFFFLPLNTIHRKMVEAKRLELQNIHNRLIQTINSEEDKQKTEATIKEITDKIDQLIDVLVIDITKKDASTIPTWPIDLPILSRFTAMIFSILAIILANIIMRQLLPYL